MGRWSQVVLGSVFLLTAASLLPFSAADLRASHLAPRLAGAAVFGSLGFALVLVWGRPYTTRAALGLLALTMAALTAAMAGRDPENVRGLATTGVVAFLSGAYALTGCYPAWFPWSEAFGTETPQADPEPAPRWR